MTSTAVMAAGAATVLAVGTQDARLLRLGLVAALWATLLGAFAAAQMRRKARSSADYADQLRSTYQLELEREVTARWEHALTVERELREHAQLTQWSEIGELRAELAAMRANLERLAGVAPSQIGPVERVTLRAESTRLLPLPAQPCGIDGSRVPGAAASPGPGRHAPERTSPASPAMHGQRTVDDLIAAHGGIASPSRRRRNHT